MREKKKPARIAMRRESSRVSQHILFDGVADVVVVVDVVLGGVELGYGDLGVLVPALPALGRLLDLSRLAAARLLGEHYTVNVGHLWVTELFSKTRDNKKARPL